MSNDIADQLEEFANEHGEPHWLVQRRIDALNNIEKLPDFSLDQFDMSKLSLPTVATPKRIKLTKEMLAEAHVNEDEIGMTQIGMSSLENTLDEDDEEQGVILTDIFTAFRQHPQLIEKYFMNKIIKDDQDAQAATHMALLNSGLFLYIPKNYQLKDQVILNMIQDNMNDQQLITHLFIYADEGSSVSVVQNLTTIGDKENPCDCIVEILARPKSQVEFFAHDNLGTKSATLIRRMAQISREAEVNWHIATNNSNYCGQLVESRLAHKSAKSNIKIASLQTGENKLGIEAIIRVKDTETANNNQIVQINNAEHLKNISLATLILDKDNQKFSGASFVSKGSHSDQVVLSTDDDLEVSYDQQATPVQRYENAVANFFDSDQ